jgi:hypothetical protein
LRSEVEQVAVKEASASSDELELNKMLAEVSSSTSQL